MKTLARVRAFMLALGIAGCSAPDKDATVPLVGPDPAGFRRSTDENATIPTGVGDALSGRCGSLDCHGQTSRNFRVYSRLGERLDPMNKVGGDDTTPAEYDATYESLVGLEPEAMAAVVDDGGAQPTRLTFIRKSRGTEKHKGGAISPAGDALDRCFTSWLSGSTNRDACDVGMTPPSPAPPR